MDNLNIKEMKLAIKIYNLKLKRNPNLTELSHMLGLPQDHSNFIKVKKYLEDKKVISFEKDRGNKIVIINYKKLQEEIPEIPFIKYYEQNFRNKFSGGFIYSK